MDQYLPAQRLLFGVAIGDTFGRAFENHSRKWIAERLSMDTYPPWEDRHYTDDTQMTLAIAELMATDLAFSKENLASFFIKAYNRDPRAGYSILTRGQLTAGRDPQSFLTFLSEEKRKERRSDGAAMRALPLGLHPDPEQVISLSCINAKTTHGHPHAIAASVGVALLSHGLYYHKVSHHNVIPYIVSLASHEMPEDVREHLMRLSRIPGFSPDVLLGQTNISNGIPYEESLPFLGAVLSLVTHIGNLPEELLKQALLLGGDTDTVAAVALGAALIIHPYADIPPFWIEGLETGPYGRDFIQRLGADLHRRYPTL